MPASQKSSCQICDVLIKTLMEKFPEMSDTLKNLVPTLTSSPSQTQTTKSKWIQKQSVSNTAKCILKALCTAQDGVSVLVNNNIPHKQVQLNTAIQAVVVRLTLHKDITLCSIYLSPNKPIIDDNLNNLLSQVPTPYILLGDFNGHNTIWGSNNTNQRGTQIEHF